MRLATLWQEAVSGRHSGLPTRLLTLGLRLLAPVYGIGAKLNRGVYDWGVLPRRTLDCPVVSVGNITVGGTGKTSAVILLAKAFARRGITPAILLRGHGRRARGVVILSGGRTDRNAVGQAGDEACMVAQMLPDAVVGVGKRREAVASQMLAQTDARAIILDDGFQYYPLARDLDIVLLDALWPSTTDRVFPAGTLREHLSNLRRADAIWLTHVDVAEATTLDALRGIGSGAKQREPIETCHQPLLLRRPDRAATQQPGALRGQAVAALSSIGNPLAFERGLQRLGAASVRPLRFADHHTYTAADLERIRRVADSADIVVTTEKDAVRLPPAAWELQGLWILRHPAHRSLRQLGDGRRSHRVGAIPAQRHRARPRRCADGGSCESHPRDPRCPCAAAGCSARHAAESAAQ